MNPADLCTKYLPGFGKVESLTSLFGCRFRDGRAASAPFLKGDTEGHPPLLSVQQETAEEKIQWGEHVYPALCIDGETLPEAYVHHHSMLPHEHEDLDDYFPLARACEPLPEIAEIADEMETRGLAIGRLSKGKKTSAHPRQSNSADDQIMSPSSTAR